MIRTASTLVLWLILSAFTQSQEAETIAPNFDREIAPILVENCLECHSGDEPEGELDLTTLAGASKGGESGAAIVPGKLDGSRLWTRIDADEMPPKHPLNAANKAVIRRWIRDGAKWGKGPLDRLSKTTSNRAGYDWWALQALQRPDVPKVEIDGIVHNPIDAFVLHALQENGLTPSGESSPRTLLRRWQFDLLGLPPTPEEIQQFEKACRTEPKGAAKEAVDRMLESKHFGERWGRHWLDVVRFGESQGFERDKIRLNSWHYRDWVIDAINKDMPYDQFARFQIAGDTLQPDNPAAVTATGFLVAGPWDEVGQNQKSAAMKAIVRQDEIEDYVGTISQTFLGLTVNCARCHDHKFDPITQKEYYQFASAVGGVRHGSRDVKSAADKQQTHSIYAVVPQKAEMAHILKRGSPATPGEVVSPGGVAAISGPNADFGLREDAPDADRRRSLANWISGADNPLFARVIVNRLWHHHFGVGLVATPNDFGFNGGRPSHPELLDWLAVELVESGWRLKHIHRLIVTSATYRQASDFRADCAAVDADNRLLWRKNPRRMEAEVLRDSILHVSGQLNTQYGGPPYRDFDTFTNNAQFYTPTDPDTPDAYRRTVYRTWVRSGRNYLLDVFDCPDPSTTTPQRAVTTTPIQSLALMNGSFVLRMSQRFAERVVADAGDEPARQVERAIQLVYGREPSDEETKVLSQFATKHGLEALCRVLLNSNEFIHVD